MPGFGSKLAEQQAGRPGADDRDLCAHGSPSHPERYRQAVAAFAGIFQGRICQMNDLIVGRSALSLH